MSKEMEKSLEGIHRELSGSERDLSGERHKSLKYHVRDINQRLGEWLIAHRCQQEKQSYDLSWALGLIGFVGVMLAITRSAGSDIDWVREHTLAFRLWGVTLCTIFLGVSLERLALVRSLWSFTATKFLVSVILSGLVFYARGRAAGFINGVFHIDASALPITLVLTTGLMVFKLLVPFVLAVAIILFLVHSLNGIGWFKNKLTGEDAGLPPLYSFLAIFVSGVILFFGWNWSSGQLGDSRVPEKVYLMAHALDFNQLHECANVHAEQPVVFLGNAQESVLVAPYRLEDFDFATFFEASITVPTNFVRKRCDYKPSPLTKELEEG